MALVAVLHALFALVLWNAMQSSVPRPTAVPPDTEQVLVVRLLDHAKPTPRPAQPPAPPAPPKPEPPRQVATRHVRPVVQEKPRPDAMVVEEPAPAASVSAQSGANLRLPPPANTWAAAAAPAKPATPPDDRRIMQHDRNRMHYKATRFEKYFPPPNETAGGAVGRHVGDALKAIAKSMCDPTKKSTAANLLCGVPPIPPSPKEGDERLNLPPPSLVDDPAPTKGPPLATCIDEYKQTKPLSYGCPLNTPDLAFKAEMRVCIDLFRAGKRLKTWCPLDTPKRAAAESAAHPASSSVGSH